MEGFLDFCFGCLFFGYMIRFGLVPPSVYKVHNNTRPEIIYTWEDRNRRLNEPKPETVVRTYNNSKQHSATDLKYKLKTDTMTWEDFHPIKHIGIDYFGMCIGLAGLALAWRAMSQLHGTSDLVWYILGIASGVMFGIFFLLYLAKLVFFPKKVCKEWMHPVKGPSFGLLTLTFVLHSLLMIDFDRKFAEVGRWGKKGGEVGV